MSVTILAIESSCDDTSAAIIRDGYMLSNLIANQDVHRSYGGVVPELASRAHQVNIIPVVDQAIIQAGITQDEIDAVAFTRGPGLLGSLLVGSSFAKAYALAHSIPLIEVNHLKAHVMSHWIKMPDRDSILPELPFLCLLVSGGHTQLLVVKEDFSIEELGSTIDDAAGEAFDKCAKVMGLTYPGGPLIDKYASKGNPNAFKFTRPRISGLNYSFSGLKTNFLYFLRDRIKEDKDFIDNNIEDLSASLQYTILDILIDKLVLAADKSGVRQIGIAGGVAANSGLRARLLKEAEQRGWEVFLPEFKFTTDNAAMIGITAYYKYLKKEFADQGISPLAKYNIT